LSAGDGAVLGIVHDAVDRGEDCGVDGRRECEKESEKQRINAHESATSLGSETTDVIAAGANTRAMG
jgi:hypothetical protein